MTQPDTMLEWVRTLGGIIVSWPIVGMLAMVLFRRPLLALLERFTGSDVQRLSVAGIFELERVRSEVKVTRSQVESLYALSMSEEAFGQLKKLETGAYGPFWLDPDLRVGLAAELTYFKIVGYIRLDQAPNVVDVRDLPRGDHPEDDLSRYVRVTPQGRAFIALREHAIEQSLRSP